MMIRRSLLKEDRFDELLAELRLNPEFDEIYLRQKPHYDLLIAGLCQCYEEMPTGHYLDGLIAEGVLLQTPCDHWERFNSQTLWLGTPKRCSHDKCYPRGKPCEYSTKWGPAGSVLEEMERRGLDVSLRTIFIEASGKITTSEARFYKNGEEIARARGRQMPIAICRAALMTIAVIGELP